MTVPRQVSPAAIKRRENFFAPSGNLTGHAFAPPSPLLAEEASPIAKTDRQHHIYRN